ncbi:uncharacterized protein LY79DRAFT_238571 [Colletotrichum navitas]|uniref:Uncharacterized protein n=1 Tax=Colletotrichum navitas TaxID=681940 RepID=A0AAD8PX25_9PEZI|nr:uncharacterized protein LY79DRAFT_238571 [Colletotrichum navitas]KAK1589693.1 hypothetical protein LY79DRAFT_238571 [Colletotrichum navitas]
MALWLARFHSRDRLLQRRPALTGILGHARATKRRIAPLTTQRSISNIHSYLPKTVSDYLQRRLRMRGPSASTQCRTSGPVQLPKRQRTPPLPFIILQSHNRRAIVAKEHPSKSRCLEAVDMLQYSSIVHKFPNIVVSSQDTYKHLCNAFLAN